MSQEEMHSVLVLIIARLDDLSARLDAIIARSDEVAALEVDKGLISRLDTIPHLPIGGNHYE